MGQLPGEDYITPEQQEVWDVDCQAQGTLAAEISTLHLTATELPAEMWDVDPESDGTLMPENSTTYVNTLDLQPEEWDVDSEVINYSKYCRRILCKVDLGSFGHKISQQTEYIQDFSCFVNNIINHKNLHIYKDMISNFQVQETPTFHPCCLEFLTEPEGML